MGSSLPADRAQAGAPAAGRQVPGIYRYKVGAFEITAVNDGTARRPMQEGFVKNAPLDAVQAALEAAFMPREHLDLMFTALVVNTGSRLVLIDAGTGGQLAPTAGLLTENLSAAGIDPKAVDTVLISHFHGDHILGLRSKEGAAVFPNAEIAVPEAEWAFWMDDGEMSRAPEGLQGNFKAVRKIFGPEAANVRRFAADAEVVPGITAVAAYGHTPGHTAFRVASESGTLLVISDTTNHPALFARNPGWHAVFDMDAAMAETTRRRIFDMLVADRMLMQGYHYPFPANGHIAKDGEGYAYVPVVWSPVL